MDKKNQNKSAVKVVVAPSELLHERQKNWKYKSPSVLWLELNFTIQTARLQTLKRHKYQHLQEQALLKARDLLTDRKKRSPFASKDFYKQANINLEAGKRFFYTPEALTLRFNLRNHPDVVNAINKLWSVDLPRDELGCIDQRGYTSLFRKIGRTLEPHASKQRLRNMEKIIREDWNRDRNGELVMSFSSFFDSIFELADIWCETMNAEDYVTFIRNLVLGVSTMQSNVRHEKNIGKRLLRSQKQISATDSYHDFSTLIKMDRLSRVEDESQSYCLNDMKEDAASVKIASKDSIHGVIKRKYPAKNTDNLEIRCEQRNVLEKLPDLEDFEGNIWKSSVEERGSNTKSFMFPANSQALRIKIRENECFDDYTGEVLDNTVTTPSQPLIHPKMELEMATIWQKSRVDLDIDAGYNNIKGLQDALASSAHQIEIVNGDTLLPDEYYNMATINSGRRTSLSSPSKLQSVNCVKLDKINADAPLAKQKSKQQTRLPKTSFKVPEGTKNSQSGHDKVVRKNIRANLVSQSLPHLSHEHEFNPQALNITSLNCNRSVIKLKDNLVHLDLPDSQNQCAFSKELRDPFLYGACDCCSRKIDSSRSSECQLCTVINDDSIECSQRYNMIESQVRDEKKLLKFGFAGKVRGRFYPLSKRIQKRYDKNEQSAKRLRKQSPDDDSGTISPWVVESCHQDDHNHTCIHSCPCHQQGDDQVQILENATLNKILVTGASAPAKVILGSRKDYALVVGKDLVRTEARKDTSSLLRSNVLSDLTSQSLLLDKIQPYRYTLGVKIEDRTVLSSPYAKVTALASKDNSRERKAEETEEARQFSRMIKRSEGYEGRAITAASPILRMDKVQTQCYFSSEEEDYSALSHIKPHTKAGNCVKIRQDENKLNLKKLVEEDAEFQDVTVIVNANRKIVLRPGTMDQMAAKQTLYKAQAIRSEMMRRRFQYAFGKSLGLEDET
ncbi:uncharacterized protein PHALS_03281 [Plasmopara halstedii]|uniref:Uncharacterized protein n=1 Tax=Plasmopara halstedii TaxID=4781 RepID=A0A0P1AWQ8_PLAHL|nr:uncharacterized protein PHALS_03281 [Plasmopara halstedii]CEG46673.1 hypothetical protein PHALS_03281 [Plasmopara halstedii]|eukprot:XP_024583042.1 hypothetical protein PHALS_03281 [Plasmopara halstedii]